MTEKLGIGLEDDYLESSDDNMGEMTKHRKIRKYQTNKIASMPSSIIDELS